MNNPKIEQLIDGIKSGDDRYLELMRMVIDLAEKIKKRDALSALALAEIDKLRSLLKLTKEIFGYEWVYGDNQGWTLVCPECLHHQVNGHAPYCASARYVLK